MSVSLIRAKYGRFARVRDKISRSKATTLTPKCSIAQRIHDQTRAIPRSRRSSSTARPQKRHFDILGHPLTLPREAVLRVLVVESVLSVFGFFEEPVVDPVGVFGWRDG